MTEGHGDMFEKPDPRIVEQGNEISEQVIGAAIAVHRHFGPGLLESAYETCLCHELFLREIRFQRQLVLPVTYKGIEIESGYRIDILVEGILVVELKAVEKLTAVHEAQLLTYLKFSHRFQGLLLNFNQLRLRDGIKRIINPAAGNSLELLNL